jgi:hypothetical protein
LFAAKVGDVDDFFFAFRADLKDSHSPNCVRNFRDVAGKRSERSEGPIRFLPARNSQVSKPYHNRKP